MRLKLMMWRLVYALLLIAIVSYGLPLLMAALHLGMPTGPVITLLQFAFGVLILLYIAFGPDNGPYPF